MALHSPEPWAPFGRQVIDANQHIIAQCGSEANPSRIAACVNFLKGFTNEELKQASSLSQKYPPHSLGDFLDARNRVRELLNVSAERLP